MSENHSVDETEESSDSFDRRRFVKALGAGGAAITGSMLGSPAQASLVERIDSKTEQSGIEANPEKTLQRPEVKNVINELKQLRPGNQLRTTDQGVYRESDEDSSRSEKW